MLLFTGFTLIELFDMMNNEMNTNLFKTAVRHQQHMLVIFLAGQYKINYIIICCEIRVPLRMNSPFFHAENVFFLQSDIIINTYVAAYSPGAKNY